MAALAATYETLVNQGSFGGVLPHIALPQAPVTITSFALSLLLVFRTNTSYFRWNEARTIWGGVLNRSRDIVRMGVTSMRPDDLITKQLLARWTIAFSKSLMAHLREDGDIEKLLSNILPPEELAKLKASPHRPVYCLHMMTEIVAKANLNPNIEVMLNTNLTYFHDSLGGCERLLRTPIPLSYTRHTCRFLLVWLFVLPFTMVQTLGWGVVPATGLISMLLLGIEEIGVQIEEPFGILSLESICTRAEADVKD